MKFTPDEILDAAARLFDEQGVGVSTAKIAAAAGVSNGTLFNYFPTKQALVDSLYLRLKRELAAALGTPDGTFEAQVRATWNRWLDWGARSPRSRRVGNLLHLSGLASASSTCPSTTSRDGVHLHPHRRCPASVGRGAGRIREVTGERPPRRLGDRCRAEQ